MRAETKNFFSPKLWTCIQEGYRIETFWKDLIAGISVGILSLPLTMAFAIASGVEPERGLFTAIIAGFLISLLGGSRVQIGGPTGAFVVIVYSVVQRHGYEGLALATLMAAGLMLLLAIMRAGVLLKFVPHPVTTGFTAGIALTIFSSQLRDFFGLPIAKMPADFLGKWAAYAQHATAWNPWAVAIGIISLAIISLLRRYRPHLPAPVFAVALTTLFVAWLELPVATIASHFGPIPNLLPSPTLPHWNLEQMRLLFPDAVAIALLGAIESLLSAVVADGLTGNRHRSNTELFAQGIANIGSVLFGGIPATGAIARTAANIRLGGKTPVAGMLHAVTVLLLMVFFAPQVAMIPLPTLAAVLIFVAWNMSEKEQIRLLLGGPRSDILVLMVSFVLTVLVDLTVALQAGVLLAAGLFLKKMSDTTSLRACSLMLKEASQEPNYEKEDRTFQEPSDDIAVLEMDGPLFFGAAQLLPDTLDQLHPLPRTLVIRMDKVPLIDATGAHVLKEFLKQCTHKKIAVRLTGLRAEPRAVLKQLKIPFTSTPITQTALANVPAVQS